MGSMATSRPAQPGTRATTSSMRATCPRPTAGAYRRLRRPRRPELARELRGELVDDPGRQRVGELQDLAVNLVIRLDVVGVAALQPRDRLVERQVEVRIEQ